MDEPSRSWAVSRLSARIHKLDETLTDRGGMLIATMLGRLNERNEEEMQTLMETRCLPLLIILQTDCMAAVSLQDFARKSLSDSMTVTLILKPQHC